MRDPIDSYLSLVNNGWLHFSPNNFEEYCSRILQMLECYSETDIFLYEDFVEVPEETLQNICKVLELSYSEFFIDLFSLEAITGDSGRSAGIISKRKRREMSDSLKAEVEGSKSYQIIKNKFGY